MVLVNRKLIGPVHPLYLLWSSSSSSSESVGGFFTSVTIFFPFWTLNGHSRDSVVLGCWLIISIWRSVCRCSLTRSAPFLSPRAVKILIRFSNRSWITMGWICGSCGVCGVCAWGCTRSRDLDRCRCLPSCGDWSSSPSLIGIGFSWGSSDAFSARTCAKAVVSKSKMLSVICLDEMHLWEGCFSSHRVPSKASTSRRGENLAIATAQRRRV